MKNHNLLQVVITLILLSMAVGSVSPVQAAAPYGVDHLRGRWDGVINGFDGADQPFVLMLDKYGVDPANASAYLYNGCMKVGSGSYAPVSARAVALAYDQFDLTLYGTAYGQVIKLTGKAFTNAARVTDDPASGAWQTAFEQSDWSAFHHDRREPNCPALNLEGDLWFRGDVYAAVGLGSSGNRSETTILESETNIVSSAVRVDLPGGGTMQIPFFTDLFSPNVDFVTSFRFLGTPEGLPSSNGTYTFTLLDVFGQPIAGAASTDIWLACPQDAPRNVSAVMVDDGMMMTWDPVFPVAGFDPGGATPVGFYQIEIVRSGEGGVFGAGGLRLTSHLIPFAGFGGFAPGFPDGMNFGNSLDELAGGTYITDTVAFSEAVHAGGFGLECQIRAWDEQIYFEKSGETIAILPE